MNIGVYGIFDQNPCRRPTLISPTSATIRPRNNAGLLVLELPDDAVMASMLRVLKSFVSQQELVEALPGRLAILEPGRVRFRPPLS